MARPLRIEFPGAWYHVMHRGIGRKSIFKSDEQKAFFLSLLADTADRFNAEWHAYCLMGNHYHLMVRTPEGNLQRIMRHINGVYTQYFNRHEDRDGALLRGRYKAILVDAEQYWLPLSRYLHRLPLESNIVDKLKKYRWSSYRAYIGVEATPNWLMTDYILNAVSRRDRHLRYAAYVVEASDSEVPEFYQRGKISPILGNNQYKASVLSGQMPCIDRPELKKERVRPAVEEIVAAVCQRFRVQEDVIWRITRGKGVTSPARIVTMYLCQKVADMRLAKIAELFGLKSYASASASIRNVERRLLQDEGLAKKVNQVLSDITA